jgi:leucyl aminopeptidase (aminopeptidase T)
VSSPPPSFRAPSASSSPSAPLSGRPPQRRISFSSLRLGTLDFDLANAARRVIEGALGVVRGEHVVLIVDRSRRDVGTALLETAREIGADPIVHELEAHGERPLRTLPDGIRYGLERAQASVLAIGFEDGEVGMRHELLEAARGLGLRHAHMIGVSRRSLIAGFSVDNTRVLDMTRAVRTRLRPDSRLRLRTPAGSDLEARLDPAIRLVEHVGSIRAGKWENLPSGRLLASPSSVRGVFVADASLGGQLGAVAGLIGDRPVRIEIEGGACKSVQCVDRSLQRDVESFVAREHNLGRIGAVILGTNVGILAPTGDIVADQNLPGLHVVFGQGLPDGAGAPWTTRAQLPMTCSGADVDLDGAPLLRAGRYMVK